MSYSSLNQNVTWMKNRQLVCMLPRHCEFKASPWIAPWHYEELGKTCSAECLWVSKTSPTGLFRNQSVDCCWTQPDGFSSWKVFQDILVTLICTNFEQLEQLVWGLVKTCVLLTPSRAFVWNHYAKELLFTGFWTMPTDLHLGNEHLLTTFPLGFLLFSAYIYIHISHDFCVYIWLRAYIH